MRFGRLDLNLLVALDKLLTLRSITLAGEQMNLTQSAMSSALRRLREYFDDPLLVQVGRQMRLTPRAEALHPLIRDVLVQVEVAVATDLVFDPKTSTQEFRIILSDYTLNVLAPHALALAHAEGATVRFRFMPQAENPSSIIDRGDADLLVAPGHLLSKDHPSEALYEDDFVALAWRDGKHGRTPPSLDDYLQARHLLMAPQTGFATFEADFMLRLGIVREFEVICYSFAALAPLVVGTDRIATVHHGLARQAVQYLPLVAHALPLEAPSIVEHVQWHRHRTPDPSLHWLLDLFRNAAARLTDGQGRIPPIDTSNP